MALLDEIKRKNPSLSEDEIVSQLRTSPEFQGMDDQEFITTLTSDQPVMGGQQAQPQQQEEEPGFWSGMSAGVDQLQAMGGGLLMAAGEALELEPMLEAGRGIYDEQMQQADRNALGYSFTDIFTDPERSIGDAWQWAKYTAGNQLPMLAASVAGGGVGGFAAGQGARMLAGAAAKQAASRIGQVAGAAGASMGMETGALMGETGDLDVSLAHGAIAGSLDAITPVRMLRAAGKNKLADRAAAEISDRVLEDIQKQAGRGIRGAAGRGSWTNAVAEASTEGLQGLINQHANYWVENNGETLLGDLGEVNFKQLIDEAAAGGLMGGALGAPAGLSERGQARRQVTQIENARRNAAAQGGDALDQTMAGQQAEQETQDAPMPEVDPAELSDVGNRIQLAMGEVDDLQNMAKGSSYQGQTRLRNMQTQIQRAEEAFEAGNVEGARRRLMAAERLGADLRSSITRQGTTERPAQADGELLGPEEAQGIAGALPGRQGQLPPGSGAIYGEAPAPEAEGMAARPQQGPGQPQLTDEGIVYGEAPERRRRGTAMDEQSRDPRFATPEEANAAWEQAWREQGVAEPSENIPDTTISIVGRGPEAADAPTEATQDTGVMPTEDQGAEIEKRSLALDPQVDNLTEDQLSRAAEVMGYRGGVAKNPDRIAARLKQEHPDDVESVLSQVSRQEDSTQPATPESVRGEPIDDEWRSFSPESGTRDVPRAEMPQIKSEHRGALANYLSARGITSEEQTVPASSLKPTQREFSEERVQAAKDREGGGRAILVSSDGHVVDGHHQWLAKVDQGEDVRVIRLSAPIDEVLEEAREFPSSEVDNAEQEAVGGSRAKGGRKWEPIEEVTAPDGFRAEIYSREGVSGKTVYGAFNERGEQLFGNQLFGSVDEIKQAIGVEPVEQPATPETVQLKTDGSPFASSSTAMRSGFAKRAQRQGRPVEAVEVEGGYGLRIGEPTQRQDTEVQAQGQRDTILESVRELGRQYSDRNYSVVSRVSPGGILGQVSKALGVSRQEAAIIRKRVNLSADQMRQAFDEGAQEGQGAGRVDVQQATQEQAGVADTAPTEGAAQPEQEAPIERDDTRYRVSDVETVTTEQAEADLMSQMDDGDRALLSDAEWQDVVEDRRQAMQAEAGAAARLPEGFDTLGDFSFDGETLSRDGEPVGTMSIRVEGEGTPRVVLDDIRIRRRGEGAGTDAIQAVIDRAAEQGMPVSLTAESMQGAQVQRRLRDYYQRLGFTRNQGADRVPGISEEFYLAPDGVDVRARKKRSDSREEIDKAQVSDFADARGMDPMQAGRARETLLAPVEIGGKQTTRKAAVDQASSVGGTVYGLGDDRRLVMSDGTTYTQNDIGKTAMDYAEYRTDGLDRHRIDGERHNNGSRLAPQEVRDSIAANKENLGPVEVVDTPAGLPDAVRQMMRREGVDPSSVKGVTHKGKVYVVTSNHDSSQDAVRTAVHEAVGHKGIRGVLGEDIDRVMLNLYRSLPNNDKGREALAEVRREYTFLDPSKREDKIVIAEEMVARLLEKGERPKAWQRAVSKIRDVLRQVFPSIAWTYTDVLALGEQSRSHLRQQQAANADEATRFAKAPPTSSSAFKRWFGNSKVVDDSGEPLVVYHGTPGDSFTEFQSSDGYGFAGGGKGKLYFTPSKKTAMDHAYYERAEKKQPDDVSIVGRKGDSRALPVYLSIQNPLYEGTAEGKRDLRKANSLADEKGTTQADELQDMGYDGILPGKPGSNLKRQYEIQAFRSNQVKSSIGNVGSYDPESADIRFSLAGKQRTPFEDQFDDFSDADKAAAGKIGSRTPKQRAMDWFMEKWDRAGLKIRQGMVDRYAALKEMDEKIYGESALKENIQSSSWVLARMSNAANGALHAMLHNGRIFLDQSEKIIKIKEGDAKGLGEVLGRLGTPAEIERFMGWIAGNRASKLAAEGRENLFDASDIEAMKGWNRGRMADGSRRNAVYEEVFKEFQQYRDDVLAVAEQSGIITPEQRTMWRDEFYVPFYRLSEDKGAPTGQIATGGLSRQQAYKKLKGGTQNVNDLLQNTMLNFHHLLDASMKNQAAQQAVENAKLLGMAEKVPESNRDTKKSTFVMEGGQKVFYEIDDPLVFESLTALAHPGFNSTLMKVMRGFKRVFTNMTTTTPQFMVANLIRDSLQAAATNEVSKNVFKNVISGGKAYADDRTRAQMMASGASFNFGHLYGTNPDEMRAQLTRGMRNANLVDGPAMIPNVLRAGWAWWGDVNNAAENVNRAAIYAQNKDKGELSAAFEARDLIDFSSHGAWPAIRVLIDIVPFLNARIQGLDKIYRSGVKPGYSVLAAAFGKGQAGVSDKQAAARFWTVAGALSMATIALYMHNHDDEEYQKLEDWQKDTYWFVRFGDKAFFIPKPFEVGAIATMAERITEQFVDDKATGKLFQQRMGHMIFDTFSFSPVPQMMQPALDVYSNVDAFTGRQIESMGMERLSPELRKRASTSKAGEWISRGLNSTIGAIGSPDTNPLALSPVQVDHLIGGYLGQIGTWVAGSGDVAWNVATGHENPAQRWHEYQPVRRFYRDLGTEDRYTKYGTIFYEGLREAGRAYSDVRELQELGRLEEAAETARDNREMLALRRSLNSAQRRLSTINKQIDAIRRSNIDGELKRQRIDRLRAVKNQIQRVLGERVQEARAR